MAKNHEKLCSTCLKTYFWLISVIFTVAENRIPGTGFIRPMCNIVISDNNCFFIHSRKICINEKYMQSKFLIHNSMKFILHVKFQYNTF